MAPEGNFHFNKEKNPINTILRLQKEIEGLNVQLEELSEEHELLENPEEDQNIEQRFERKIQIENLENKIEQIIKQIKEKNDEIEALNRKSQNNN